ncbi:MAG: radical SAM protein [Desulfobacterales bacterium]|jgi:hypothetical protein
MLAGIHFILTYTCNFECDHCFLYSSPQARGTFTIDQVERVLAEAEKMGTLEWIFFEGGEPFLFFPLLKESISRARAKGFKVGVVTNAYGAHSEADAELWLKPLAASGLTYLGVSNDAFHYGEETENAASIASAVAGKLGIDTTSICIDPPIVAPSASDEGGKGQPVVGGGAMFRGRAVEKLTANLPLRPWRELVECPYEELATPSRVHVDALGNVQICQGISMGNMWATPLSELVADYRCGDHAICGPLRKGGPAALAQALAIEPEAGYVDECHLCYCLRRAAIERYPELLAPRQVYGLAS